MNRSVSTRRVFSPIGLEMSPTSIAAAQWRFGRAGRTLAASVRFPRSAIARQPKDATASTDAMTSAEVAHIARVLSRHGFQGRDVVLAAPDDRVMIATLELPPRSSGAPLPQIAAAELARMNRQEPGALRTQLWEIASPARAGSADSTHAMVAGLVEREAQDWSRAFEDAGLTLAAIDARCWSLARVCQEMVGSTPEPSAAIVLDVGESGALLVVARLEGTSVQVVYERSIAGIGLDAMRARLAELTQLPSDIVDHLLRPGGLSGEVDVSAMLAGEIALVLREHADTLATEIAAASSYTAHRYPVPLVGMFLCGAALEATGFLEAIRARLPIQPEAMRVLRPMGLARTDPEREASARDLDCHDAGLTTACGLALYPSEAAA